MRDNEQKTQGVAQRLVRIALGKRPSLGRVLDVGCGIGSILAECGSCARTQTGVDVNPVLVEAAKRRLPKATLALHSVEDSALPFQDRAFDTIFFCDVIEHLHSPYVALKALYRVLADDGLLLVTTPNAGSAIRRFRGERWFGLQDNSHLYFFDEFTLSHLARQAGFAVQSARSNGFTGSLLVDRAVELARSGGTLTLIARK